MSQPQFNADSSGLNVRHGVQPPPLPAARPELLSGLAITALCVGSVFTFITASAVAVALLAPRAEAQTAQIPPPAQRVRADVPPPPRDAAPAIARPAAAIAEAGITYTNVRVASVPWSIHILKIDRSRADLGFYSAHARNRILGVSMLSDQARSVPADLGKGIAAINGDFYLRDNPTYAGDPRGLQIMNGELISAPDTVCVWFDAKGAPNLGEVKGDFSVTWPGGAKTRFGLNQQRMPNSVVLFTPTYGTSTRVSGGRELVLEKSGDSWLPLRVGQTYTARVREVLTEGNTPLQGNLMVLSIGPSAADVPEVKVGDVVKFSTATIPDLTGVQSAIGGGPAIVQNGKPFALHEPPPGQSRNYSEASKYQRHPRSAIGWNATHVFLVTVDGRQPGLSVGMKLAELGEYLVSLGCTEGMNFDGGKSAQLWMSGPGILNSPAQGEDTVANSLIVVRKKSGG